MEMNDLKDLLVENLKDLYSAEKQILQRMGERAGGKKCKGMEGLIEENKELLEEDAEPEVLDAGLIVGLQKIEHYEIAGYGSAVTFAKLLGDEESAQLLARTLDEEERTDKKLSEIAESTINVQAAEGAGEEDEEEDDEDEE